MFVAFSVLISYCMLCDARFSPLYHDHSSIYIFAIILTYSLNSYPNIFKSIRLMTMTLWHRLPLLHTTILAISARAHASYSFMAFCGRCDRWFGSERALEQHKDDSNMHHICYE